MLTIFVSLNLLILGILGNIAFECPAGTIQSTHDNKWCYKFFNQSASYDDAEYYCENFGGYLTEINDQFTNTFLAHNAKTNFKDGSFWTGGKLYQSGSCSIWVWNRDNSILSYFDWSRPEAGTSADGSCFSVSVNDGTWSPQDCSIQLPYVCQVQASIDVCEPGWTYNGFTKKCYKVFTQQSTTLALSEKNCVAENAHLASIHSQIENDFVGDMTSTLIVAAATVDAVIIGAYSNANYQWFWTDGTKVDYLAWGQNDPDHLPSFCSVYYPDGFAQSGYENYVKKWDAINCAWTVNRYICKKDPTSVQMN